MPTKLSKDSTANQPKIDSIERVFDSNTNNLTRADFNSNSGPRGSNSIANTAANKTNNNSSEGNWRSNPQPNELGSTSTPTSGQTFPGFYRKNVSQQQRGDLPYADDPTTYTYQSKQQPLRYGNNNLDEQLSQRFPLQQQRCPIIPFESQRNVSQQQQQHNYYGARAHVSWDDAAAAAATANENAFYGESPTYANNRIRPGPRGINNNNFDTTQYSWDPRENYRFNHQPQQQQYRGENNSHFAPFHASGPQALSAEHFQRSPFAGQQAYEHEFNIRNSFEGHHQYARTPTRGPQPQLSGGHSFRGSNFGDEFQQQRPSSFSQQQYFEYPPYSRQQQEQQQHRQQLPYQFDNSENIRPTVRSLKVTPPLRSFDENFSPRAVASSTVAYGKKDDSYPPPQQHQQNSGSHQQQQQQPPTWPPHRIDIRPLASGKGSEQQQYPVVSARAVHNNNNAELPTAHASDFSSSSRLPTAASTAARDTPSSKFAEVKSGGGSGTSNGKGGAFGKAPFGGLKSSVFERVSQPSPPISRPATSVSPAIAATSKSSSAALYRAPRGRSDGNAGGVLRQFRATLNKLAPDNFDRLIQECLSLLRTKATESILKDVMDLIYEKALSEHKYSSLYAGLCFRLEKTLPNFDPPSQEITTFKRLLLEKVQKTYMTRARYFGSGSSGTYSNNDDAQEAAMKMKQKQLNNMKFIGELGKIDLLTPGILLMCIEHLLLDDGGGESDRLNNNNVIPRDGGRGHNRADDLECLCQILKIVGKLLYNDADLRVHRKLDSFMESLRHASRDKSIEPRVRFFCLDIVDLHENKWIPKRLHHNQRLKTLREVRLEADREAAAEAESSNAAIRAMPSLLLKRNTSISGGAGSSNNNMNSPGGGGGDNNNNMYFNNNSQRASPGNNNNNNMSNYNNSYNRQQSQLQQQYNNNNNNAAQKSQQMPKTPSFNNMASSFGGQQPSPQAPPQNRPYNNNNSQQQQQQQFFNNNQSAGGGYNNNNNANQYYGSHQSGSTDMQQMYQQHQQPYQNQQQQQQQMRIPSGSVAAGEVPPEKSSNNIGVGGGDSVSTKKYLNLLQRKKSGPALGASPSADEALTFAPKSSLYHNMSNTKSSSTAAGGTAIKNAAGAVITSGGSGDGSHVTNGVAAASDGGKSKSKSSADGSSKENAARTQVLALAKEYLDAASPTNSWKRILQVVVPKRVMNSIVIDVLRLGFDRGTDSWSKTADLFGSLLSDGKWLKKNQFFDALDSFADQATSGKQRDPSSSSSENNDELDFLTVLLVHSVKTGALAVDDMLERLAQGRHFPLSLKCLSTLQRDCGGEQWLAKQLQKSSSRVGSATSNDLAQVLLPPSELARGNQRVVELLEEHSLAHLCLERVIESEIEMLLDAQPDGNKLRTLLGEKSAEIRTHENFTFILVHKLFERFHIASVGNEPEKPAQQYKSMVAKQLKQYKPLLAPLLKNTDNQLLALYALQRFYYAKNFPRGWMLLWFTCLYEEDLVDEPTFWRWREQVNHKYPGKGQALFGLNAWFEYLKNAEIEEEEDDHNGGETTTHSKGSSKSSHRQQQQQQQQQSADVAAASASPLAGSPEQQQQQSGVADETAAVDDGSSGVLSVDSMTEVQVQSPALVNDTTTQAVVLAENSGKSDYSDGNGNNN